MIKGAHRGAPFFVVSAGEYHHALRMVDEIKPITIDFVADPICPWCLIGFRSFQHARERLSEFKISLRIRAYELIPNWPAEGKDRKQSYEERFPDPQQRTQSAMQLKAAAMGAGFAFDPEKPDRIPNTRKAQQLIRLAHFDSVQERVADALYTAYWEFGADISDEAILLALAAECGMDRDNAERDLADAQSANTVLAEASAFRQAGVGGVPTFIVNEQHGFTGAFPPAQLASRIREMVDPTTP